MEEYDLMQCIDRALDRFGSSVKNAVFLKMSFIHKSDSSGIFSDPAAFKNLIEEIFGDSAVEIEKSITSEIKKVFRLAAGETKNLVSTINAAKELVIGTFSGIVSESKSSKVLIQPKVHQVLQEIQTESKTPVQS